MPIKMNFAQKRANLKKYGYHASFRIDSTKIGNNTSIGTITKM